MQSLKENEDYEFIAVDGEDDSWRIRLLTGAYSETIISFGKVTAFPNENTDVRGKYIFYRKTVVV